MKKKRREIYQVLANEVDTHLCSFCHFEEPGYGCGDSLECLHPLSDHVTFPEVEDPGDDCWGFRPNLCVSDLADVVGIILAQGWRTWNWSKSDTGQITVHGNSRKEVL